jgi:hypothetical protein
MLKSYLIGTMKQPKLNEKNQKIINQSIKSYAEKRQKWEQDVFYIFTVDFYIL